MDEVSKKLIKPCFTKRTQDISSVSQMQHIAALGQITGLFMEEKPSSQELNEILTPSRTRLKPQTGPDKVCPWARTQNYVPFVLSLQPLRKVWTGLCLHKGRK